MRVLAVLCLTVGLLVAGCGGGDDDGGEENGAAGSDRGKALFTAEAAPPCGSCHTLADAETSGAVGPNLDELQPTADRVERAMREGPGAMPRYDETLSEEDVSAVAAYVEAAAGG
jgi:sulfite dehydrogenase